MEVSKENAVSLNAESLRTLTLLSFKEHSSPDLKKPFSSKEEFCSAIEIAEDRLPFPFKVAIRRLEVFGLPWTFSVGAFLCLGLFPGTIGGTMVMLIDLLGEYGDNQVTVEDVVKVYPWGFYSEEALSKRIDEIKTDEAKPESDRTIKYSYVYQ